jgi:hypothetical protein
MIGPQRDITSLPNYLGPRHLGQYLDLFQALITAADTAGSM